MSKKLRISVPLDEESDRVLRRAANHGGLTLSAFIRGASLLFVQEHKLHELPTGRPPKMQSKRRYNPHGLPQSVEEIRSNG